LPANADPRFAVRTSKSLDSCDDALGRTFQPEAEQNPAKAGEMWTRSRKSMMLGNKDRALKEMCLSASFDIDGRGTYGLSEYYFRESDFAQALLWAERVPEASRRYVDARAMIGDVKSQQGDVAGALDAFVKGWNMSASDKDDLREVAGGFAQAADSAMRKKDWWTAERFYRRALTLDEERADAATGLARVLLRFELPKPAAVWAERALELDSHSSGAALALCEARIATRDAKGARAALKRLRAMAPNDPAVDQMAQQVDSL
jgi:tetratricopeptide (TPR) repeat protein